MTSQGHLHFSEENIINRLMEIYTWAQTCGPSKEEKMILKRHHFVTWHPVSVRDINETCDAGCLLCELHWKLYSSTPCPQTKLVSLGLGLALNWWLRFSENKYLSLSAKLVLFNTFIIKSLLHMTGAITAPIVQCIIYILKISIS